MKYPLDIVSLVRKKTFSVSASFSQETTESPLKIFSKLSRLRLCIINENKVAATANLKPDQLAAIRARSEYAFGKYMEHQFSSKAESGQESDGAGRAAYTVKFVAGTLKGKSPADVLREEGFEKGKDTLNRQYKWLKENVQKYPGNQKLMDAIVDASKLSKDDIGETAASTEVPITILQPVSKPIMRDQRKEDGFYKVDELSIIWDSSRKNPVTVCINNYYAPVIKNEDGTLNVQISRKDKNSEIRNTFAIGADEWIGCLQEVDDCISNFKMLHTKSAWDMAMKAFFDNKKAATDAK